MGLLGFERKRHMEVVLSGRIALACTIAKQTFVVIRMKLFMRSDHCKSVNGKGRQI